MADNEELVEAYLAEHPNASADEITAFGDGCKVAAQHTSPAEPMQRIVLGTPGQDSTVVVEGERVAASEGTPRSSSKGRTIPLRPIKGTPDEFFARCISESAALEQTLTKRVGERPVFDSRRIIIRER